MIFAIVGILVLVISFVIALVTLIREQSKMDSIAAGDEEDKDKGEDGPTSSKQAHVDPLLTHKAEELSPHRESLDTSRVHMDVVAAASMHQVHPGLEDVAPQKDSVAEKPRVWWERLENDTESLEEKNEDEKSIEKIREELAKLMSTKTKVVEEDEASDEGLIVENPEKPTQGGLAASTLAGEFSLREIKKKD